MHDLCADKATLKVGMDDARTLRRLGARPERPGPALLVPGGEKGAPAEQTVRRLSDPGKRPLSEAKALHHLGPVPSRQLRCFGFELHADAKHFCDLGQLVCDGLGQRFWLAAGDGFLAEVDYRKDWFVREHEERPEQLALLRFQARAVKRRPVGKQTECPVEGCHLAVQRMVLLGCFSPALELCLRARQVGQHELELEHRQVFERVGTTGHIRVIEGPQYETDGIRFTDPAKEPVAQPFTG